MKLINILKVLSSKSFKATINGKSVEAKKIQILLDDEPFNDISDVYIDVKVEGDIHGFITSENGNITVNGVVSDGVETRNGNIICAEVTGYVKTVNGDVSAKSVVGPVSTVNGDVKVG